MLRSVFRGIQLRKQGCVVSFRFFHLIQLQLHVKVLWNARIFPVSCIFYMKLLHDSCEILHFKGAPNFNGSVIL